VSKALKTKQINDAKGAIENDSEVDINLVVKIVGRLKRAKKPKPAKGTARIPWKVAMALFAQRSGFTREQTADLLASSLIDAINSKSDKEASLLDNTGVGDALAMLDREVFSKLPTIPKEGNISFDAQCVEAIRTPILVASNDTDSSGEGEDVAK
tara:strand:- start:3029 stop:3493 length:465 start_codon:yes stop_codon:yes gene_type:complete